MPDNYSIEFTQPQPSGHPHDLLARLYREIGISAVAAALEVAQFSQKPAEAVKIRDEAVGAPVLLGENLAA